MDSQSKFHGRWKEEVELSIINRQNVMPLRINISFNFAVIVIVNAVLGFKDKMLDSIR